MEWKVSNLSRLKSKYQLLFTVDSNCTACELPKSHHDALVVRFDGRISFICAECLERFDEADRQADEVSAMLDDGDYGGAA
jgi:hypothetical protein